MAYNYISLVSFIHIMPSCIKNLFDNMFNGWVWLDALVVNLKKFINILTRIAKNICTSINLTSLSALAKVFDGVCILNTIATAYVGIATTTGPRICSSEDGPKDPNFLVIGASEVDGFGFFSLYRLLAC